MPELVIFNQEQYRVLSSKDDSQLFQQKMYLQENRHVVYLIRRLYGETCHVFRIYSEYPLNQVILV